MLKSSRLERQNSRQNLRVKVRFFVCVLLTFFALPLFGQRTELGLGIAATNYKGDLAKLPHLRSTLAGASLLFRYHLGEAVSWTTTFAFALLHGNDKFAANAFQKKRAHAFDANLFELSTGLEYHFLNFRGRKAQHKYSPYLFAGIGLAHFNISATPEPDKNTPEPPFLNPVIPYGLGIKKVLNPKLTLALAWQTRQTFTDYLDRLSGQNDTPKFRRGNPANNDKYYFLQLSLSYRFYAVSCPDASPVRTRRKKNN